MHPHAEAAFQEIDAGVFSSDALHCDAVFRERLTYFLGRWQKQLDETVLVLREPEASEGEIDERA